MWRSGFSPPGAGPDGASARHGALAGAGEILVSRDAAPKRRLDRLPTRAVTLKGIAHPVVTIDWR